jgi:recombination protein RecA
MSNQLDEVLAKLRKKYGAAILSGSDIRSIELDRVSTGSLALDIETGGGLPYGRICEFWGLESCGKTTLAMKVVANVQKEGKPVVWIDAEGVFDGEWAKLMGIDLDKLTLAKPQTGEEVGDILVSVVQSGECGLVVLDSVGSLMPALEQEKSMTDDPEKVGGIAMLMTRMMKRTTSSLNTYDEESKWNNCLVLLLNQVREDLKVKYGNPEKAPGGHALQHACSIIVRLRRGEWIESELEGGDKVKIGHAIKFRTEKNKTFAPFRESQFNFYFSGDMKGQIDSIDEVMRYGELRGIINVAGRTYQYGELKAVGRENFLTLLRADKKLVEKIKTEVMKVALHV